MGSPSPCRIICVSFGHLSTIFLIVLCRIISVPSPSFIHSVVPKLIARMFVPFGSISAIVSIRWSREYEMSRTVRFGSLAVISASLLPEWLNPAIHNPVSFELLLRNCL